MELNKNYEPAAYLFVRQSLDYALKSLESRRHITGGELLQAIAEFGRLRYGPLARMVFEEWGIHETLDFGYIVFDLVDKKVMSKREEDTLEDFRNVYDFGEVFELDYDYLKEIRNCGGTRL